MTSVCSWMLGGTAAIGMGALIAVYALAQSRRVVRVTRIHIQVRDLDPAFDGYRIGILSDLHHGPHTSRRHLVRGAQVLSTCRPDLIALLGDYGTSHRFARRASRHAYHYTLAHLGECLHELRAPDGIVGILGNHDHIGGAPQVTRWLRNQGVRVLVNDHLTIRRGDGLLLIGGVDDVEEGHVDPYGGCRETPPEVPRVILSHNPDGIRALAENARADLVVSGHTHGGQVVLPFVGAAVRNCAICGPHSAYGWIPNPRAPLFVTSGLGVQIPARIGSTAEVLLVTLCCDQQPA